MATIYDKYTEENNGKNRAIGQVRPDILKLRFLELYSQTAHVYKTCQMLGMVTKTLYQWKYSDPKFLEAFKKADEVAVGVLEDEATQRALYGIDRPVFQGGKLVGTVREYSDTLLIQLLKAKAPHKYKERFSGELTGANGEPLNKDMKVIHVHSKVPIAQDESMIVQHTEELSYEDIPQTTMLPASVNKDKAPPSAPMPPDDEISLPESNRVVEQEKDSDKYFYDDLLG